jgi:phenylalanyl-tRNA synthetase beta chain
MLISRNILQSFFSQTLPDSAVIARELTMKSFEVESVDIQENDTVFTIDVLPNRGSDCLSHLGIAREVSVIFNLPIDSFDDSIEPLEERDREKLHITVEENAAPRFIGVVLSGLDNKKESPQSLRDSLVALGERSIGPIVDVTNYVMLLVGQPLHAYDADKLKVMTKEPLSLHVGFSKKGEVLQTLSGEVHELDETYLLIRGGPEGKPVGLAGIKGGISTAVDETTSKIVLEAASFAPTAVRKSAQSARLHTGASKRFENGIMPELSVVAVRTALRLLQSIYPNLVVEVLRDEYVAQTPPTHIHLRHSHVSELLGTEITTSKQAETLSHLGAIVEEKADAFVITPPWYRPDLKHSVDLVEEIGRLNGYEAVEARPLSKRTASLDSAVLLNEMLRDFLINRGYDEIITRSFQKEGEVELENPLAKNAPFLRKNLIENMKNSLALNAQNAELLELEYVKLFEIGTVFTKDAEETHLAIGIQKTKNVRTKLSLAQEVEEIEKGIPENTPLNADFSTSRSEMHEGADSTIVEYNLNAVDSTKIGGYVLKKERNQPSKYFSEFSAFPYVLRDVAVWTPHRTSANKVEEIIRKSLGPDLRVVTLFDEFEKDFEGVRRTSFAFRLVFQSFQRTLSDDAVNIQMKALERAISETEGFEMR